MPIDFKNYTYTQIRMYEPRAKLIFKGTTVQVDDLVYINVFDFSGWHEKFYAVIKRIEYDKYLEDTFLFLKTFGAKTNRSSFYTNEINDITLIKKGEI